MQMEYYGRQGPDQNTEYMHIVYSGIYGEDLTSVKCILSLPMDSAVVRSRAGVVLLLFCRCLLLLPLFVGFCFVRFRM